MHTVCIMHSPTKASFAYYGTLFRENRDGELVGGGGGMRDFVRISTICRLSSVRSNGRLQERIESEQ